MLLLVQMLCTLRELSITTKNFLAICVSGEAGATHQRSANEITLARSNSLLSAEIRFSLSVFEKPAKVCSACSVSREPAYELSFQHYDRKKASQLFLNDSIALIGVETQTRAYMVSLLTSLRA